MLGSDCRCQLDDISCQFHPCQIGPGEERIEGLPAILRRIAPLTPFYWATQAYRAILEKHAGVAGVLMHAAVLTAIGVVLLTLGTAALGRAARRGAAA